MTIMDHTEMLHDGQSEQRPTITLIDRTRFAVLSQVAAQNVVTAEDLASAAGLLILPPLQDTIDKLPLDALIELCQTVRTVVHCPSL